MASAAQKMTPQPKGTPLERVAKLKDVIAKGGDEAQQLRRLPDDAVDVLIEEGMFRFTLPPELGGEDASSLETIEVLEAMSAIDASVGWNVMLGSEINAMAAGGMDKELAKEVYLDNPRVIMCGGGGPGSQPSYAIEQEDGSYKVWGETTFISGCHNATWCPIALGQARLTSSASPSPWPSASRRLTLRQKTAVCARRRSCSTRHRESLSCCVRSTRTCSRSCVPRRMTTRS